MSESRGEDHNAVEAENSNVGITYDGVLHSGWIDLANRDLPPAIPTTVTNEWSMNVETHDYSLAKGTGDPGTLLNGLRLPDESEGYYHFLGWDQPDYDNWGVLQMLNGIEKVGRLFRRVHINGARMGVGDISTNGGGYWSDHPGRTHQQGLNADIRYLRTVISQEDGYDFSAEGPPYPNFNLARTQDLINLFIQNGATRIIVDYRSGIPETAIIVHDNPPTDHHDHFHVEFADPDGTSN